MQGKAFTTQRRGRNSKLLPNSSKRRWPPVCTERAPFPKRIPCPWGPADMPHQDTCVTFWIRPTLLSESAAVKEIRAVKDPWFTHWLPRLTSSSSPLSPYRVIWDLYRAVDLDRTIVTHDAGSPRDQMTPFWSSTTPLSYLGWGNTTQLGYGLGLALGAKLIAPEKLCVYVCGDAAVGFTGMDFETAVRERLPILVIVLNNFCMACDLDLMPAATERFRSTDIGGNYADLARALGGYGERITEPA